MRLASVNQDRGVRPGRPKGAAVHLVLLREAFEELGCEVVAFDEPDGEKLHRALVAEHGRAPFDLVYERYALGCDGARRFAGRRRIPHVLEVNAPLADEAVRWRGERADPAETARDRRLFAGADVIVCVSRLVADYAVARGASPGRVHVLGNGVDRRRFHPREGDDLLRGELVPRGRLALGFHGRLRPWHGFDLLARATEELLGAHLPVHLLCVGAGDFEAYLRERVPAAHVTLVPWVPPAEIGRYVAATDVLPLTYPAAEPCYFSPLKLAEAMASGVVPVVPRLGDLPEVVAHRCNGLVYEADDLRGLVGCVRSLIEEPEFRRRLRTGALEGAGPSWRELAGRVLDLVAAAAGTPSSLGA